MSSIANPICRKACQGFSMVEFLMAAFILSVGLLGLAALQVSAQSQGLGGRQRGTAAIMAHNLLDTIQAEGALAAGERALSETGVVTSTGFTYIDPVGAAASTTLQNGPEFTILGLLPNDPYYTAHPEADKTIAFKTTWRRNEGKINPYAKSGIQEFTVNVTWSEFSKQTNAIISKSISVSRYVRI